MPTSYDIIETKQPSSFFQFIDNLINEPRTNWDRPLHRLCSLFRKMGCTHVIKEGLEVNDINDLAKEKEGLDSFFEEDVSFEATRLTFICSDHLNERNIPDIEDKSFLASIILTQFRDLTVDNHPWHPYVFKAFVSLPRKPIANGECAGSITYLLNNYYHVNRTYECSCGLRDGEERTFNIKGTFFCQQNSKTSVCAHAGLRMILNNRDGMDLTTSKINEILNLSPNKSEKRYKRSWGLSVDEVVKVITSFNLKCKQWNFFAYPTWDYAQYTHRSVESKFPSLLAFSTANDMHVVPVVGHTLNSDMWRPEAEFQYKGQLYRMTESQLFGLNTIEKHVPAASWVDHFIIHDDNFGPYYCLPVDSLRRATLPRLDPHFRAYHLISILPSDFDIKASSREAEWASVLFVEYLVQPNKALSTSREYWAKKICQSYRNGEPWVVRTALIDKDTFVNNLSDDRDYEGYQFTQQEIEFMTSNLPDWFYLSEISLPDLYTTNKSKLIDIVYTCDQEPWDPRKKKIGELFQRVLLCRVPGSVYVAAHRKSITSNVKSHMPLFRVDPTVTCEEW